MSIPVEGNTSCTHIDVELYYSKGGMNYFTSRNEERGLYLSVSPLEKGDRFVKYSAFSGIKKHVKAMKAFSQKAFDTFQPSESDIQQLINHVVESNGIRLRSSESC